MSPVTIDSERCKAADTVLLDIEGTISSISFVKDTLYPYALRRLTRLALESWDKPDFQELVASFPEEKRKDAETLVEHVEDLTRNDVKAVYLKQMQGKLWKQGYSNGEITTPLYPDVLPTLEAWLAIPKTLAIFSSGSVEAQLNFFKYIEISPPKDPSSEPLKSDEDADGDAHTGANPTTVAEDPETNDSSSRKRQRSSPHELAPESSDLPPSPSTKKSKVSTTSSEPASTPVHTPKTRDLNPLFAGKFDTVTAGSKLEDASYLKICKELGTAPEKVVFLTDNVKEAAAATAAALYAIVVDRPGNAPLAADIYDTYPVITALDQLPL